MAHPVELYCFEGVIVMTAYEILMLVLMILLVLFTAIAALTKK